MTGILSRAVCVGDFTLETSSYLHVAQGFASLIVLRHLPREGFGRWGFECTDYDRRASGVESEFVRPVPSIWVGGEGAGG
jgi:hypothetical protein